MAVLDPIRVGDTPVRIYENRLWRRIGDRALGPATPKEVEALKWAPEPWLADAARPLPDLGFTVPEGPTTLLLFVTLPAFVLYGLLLLVAGRKRRPLS